MRHTQRDEQTILEEILIQQKKIAAYIRCLLFIQIASIAFFVILVNLSN